MEGEGGWEEGKEKEDGRKGRRERGRDRKRESTKKDDKDVMKKGSHNTLHPSIRLIQCNLGDAHCDL